VTLPVGPAVTASWSLDQVVDALRRAPEIEAVALIGSAAGGLRPWSDLDLLVVLGDGAPPLSSLATRIDGRFADVLFFRAADLSRPDVRIAHWLSTGRVLFDRTEVFSRVPPAPALEPNYAQRYGTADHASYNLAHTRRMLAAGDPLYQRALDWRFLYQLLDLWQGYFRLRGLPSRGEKEDIRYLAAHDSDWLELFERCLHETDRPRRVELYAQLVAATVGEVWSGDVTAVTLAEPSSGPGDIEAALSFWSGLFA
jgi:predicted nucleotidyltransferase